MRTHAEFDKLSNLKENWDSYGGKPIDKRSISTAQAFLELVINQNCQIVPCADGGVQLEWHVCGWDLEIEFKPDGTIEVLMERPVEPESLYSRISEAIAKFIESSVKYPTRITMTSKAFGQLKSRLADLATHFDKPDWVYFTCGGVRLLVKVNDNIPELKKCGFILDYPETSEAEAGNYPNPPERRER